MSEIKLTKAQRALLKDVAQYDGGWVECHVRHELRPAQALEALGLIETTGGHERYFDARVTPAGQAFSTPIKPEQGEA